MFIRQQVKGEMEMELLSEILRIFDTRMEAPKPYGAFHLVFLFLTALVTVLLCVTHKKASPDRPRRVVFITAVIVFIFEIYKQIHYSFSYGDTIVFKYAWYIFPWQLCSIPMYAGLLTGIFRKGKLHDALCAFLATYAIFAGICVMVYPIDAVCTVTGVNIQTMICHGSMIVVGIYLLYSQYVKLEHKTILKALPVFFAVMLTAIALNEIIFAIGLPSDQVFNMFFISPHYPSTLVLYSDVQAVIPYPFCTLIYFAAATLAAYVILLTAMLIKHIYSKLNKEKPNL